MGAGLGNGILHVISGIMGLAIIGLLLRRSSEVVKITTGVSQNLGGLIKTASFT